MPTMRKIKPLGLRSLLALFVCFFAVFAQANAKVPLLDSQINQVPVEPQRKLIIVTIDGLRWQEVFGGADSTLLQDTRFVTDIERTTSRFWDNDKLVRRKTLLPFISSTITEQGLLIGDKNNGSSMTVSNQQYFSYPGYNEIFTGKADPNLTSNAKIPNPNITFLEWLNNQAAFAQQVAIFSGWDVFPMIYNSPRSGLLVNAGFERFELPKLPPQRTQQNAETKIKTDTHIAAQVQHINWLNQLQAEIPSPWHNVRFDAFTYGYAKAYLQARKPAVLVLNLGETDDFAHDGKYDAYLDSAQQTDAYLQDLWHTVQSMPEYKDNTNMLIITDHGRGSTAEDWQHHASKKAVETYMPHLQSFKDGVVGSADIWFAAIGPDIQRKGLLVPTQAQSQSQFAATALSLLGQDYRDYSDSIPAPIEGVLSTPALAPAPTSTTILFGSCSHQDKPMPIFNAILQEQAEGFVFLGDNIYGDTEDMQVLRDKYQKLGNNPHIQALRAKMPVYAIWDDHDFGENDAGADYPFKEASKEIMLDFWQVPKDSPRRTRPDGLYGSYMLGQGEQTIHLIMPDLRYNRSSLNSVDKIAYIASRKPNDMGPYSPSDGAMLGENQWHWLEQELQKPGKIKIIASSLQLLADFTGWESWANFPADRERLFSLIKKYKVNGVFIISGDTHWGEISRYDQNLDYPLWDITSSGLTEEWKQVSPNKHRDSQPTSEVNYGYLQVNWQPQDAAWPQIEFGLKDINGEVFVKRSMSLQAVSAY